MKIFELDGEILGTEVQNWQDTNWKSISLRLLRPFSWDAKDRGFEVVNIELRRQVPVILVCGPYATADAAALNDSVTNKLDFPAVGDGDGVLYKTIGSIADVNDRFQDAAGWFTLAGEKIDGKECCVALSLKKSNTQLIVLQINDNKLSVSLVLPKQIYPLKSIVDFIDLPNMLIEQMDGGHHEASKFLKELIISVMPERARDYLSPVIADTWGFDTNINQDLINSVSISAGKLGAEIITVDKGWEKSVGDWVANDRFPGGLEELSRLVKRRGVSFGLWAAIGNVNSDSDLIKIRPNWIAKWHGKAQVVSHRNFSLCMGHSPVIEYLKTQLDHLISNGMNWFLHDFETISRCDRNDHDHPSGLGEDWAVRGWYEVLRDLRERHPNVWVENCWNGGRVLDLQMVSHHDSTIGDDWCKVRHNAVAKVGLGNFLPAHWCSSYMSDEEDLPLTSQLAIYAVGGPWVLMGDIPNWTDEKMNLAKRVLSVYREWRPRFPQGSVVWADLVGLPPSVGWKSDQDVIGISLLCPDGAELMACVILNPLQKEIIWHPRFSGSVRIKDEFNDNQWLIQNNSAHDGVTLDSTSSQGYLFSAIPII